MKNGLILIDKDKCVNCHACIATCPIKYCNDGSGDYVKINNEMCIECGNCLTSCTHNARYYKDDFQKFVVDLNKKQKIVVLLAPAIESNFCGKTGKIITWLKKIGVEAVFDVSFGAELYTKSTVELLKQNKLNFFISSACPPIVKFLEIYVPEFKENLLPIHSPIGHTILMIKRNFLKFKDYKFAVFTPCIAKKSEFKETNLGDYNITFFNLKKYFDEKNICIDEFNESEFDGSKPERGSGFSSPGGFYNTICRYLSDISQFTRQIEGQNDVYDYITKLQTSKDKTYFPFILDCLNCKLGCNGGTASIDSEKLPDELEFWINKKKYENFIEQSKDEINSVIDKYWEPELYHRKFKDKSKKNKIKIPSEKQLKNIYLKMHKYSYKDLYNCNSCGYGTCEKMAVAIYNKMNKPENCHFYLSNENKIEYENKLNKEQIYKKVVLTTNNGFIQVNMDEVIEEINPSFCMMLGYLKNEIINQKIGLFLDNKNQIKFHKKKNLFLERKIKTFKLEMLTKNGKPLKLEFSTSILSGSNKNISGWFALVSRTK